MLCQPWVLRIGDGKVDRDKGGGVGRGLEVTEEFGEAVASDRDGEEGRGWVVIQW
jgi:hypothetical protein